MVPVRPAIACAALIGLAGLLMLPFLLGPTPLQDSHWINLVWADQFTRLIKAGTLWPRWLPWSHDGLGAPVFYFYGPVAFWMAGLAGLAGLPLFASIVATAFVALAASGVGTFLLLRARGAPRPLIGALFYVVAPYHQLDFGRRGALAEFVAMALLPFLALALDRSRSRGPALLAAAYAALIMAHLPMALLASLFLIPLLLCESGLPDGRRLATVATGLGCGIALAAPYLLPAIALQAHVEIGALQALPFQRPEAWTPATYLAARAPAHLLLLAIGLGLALFGLAVAIADRSRRALALLILTGIALGCAAPLWRLPLLDRVQFPWRLLGIAEFAAALLIASVRWPGPRLLLATAPLLLLSWLIWLPSWRAIGTAEPSAATAFLFAHHPDVPEYLPRGFGPQPVARSDAALALAARTPALHEDGGVVTVHRFAFPHWRIRCAGLPVPAQAAPDGLLRYRGRDCEIDAVATRPEHLGLLIAVAALALLLSLRLIRSGAIGGIRPSLAGAAA